MRHYFTVSTLLATTMMVSLAAAADTPARSATTVIPVTVKSFDKAKPKALSVEIENKSGKEISRLQGGLTFTDKAGKVLFATGMTEDVGKWAADAKSERHPFTFFEVPAVLVDALTKDEKSVKVEFKASNLKYTNGTEEKF